MRTPNDVVTDAAAARASGSKSRAIDGASRRVAPRGSADACTIARVAPHTRSRTSCRCVAPLLALVCACVAASACRSLRHSASQSSTLRVVDARGGHELAWWEAQRAREFPAPPSEQLDALVDELCAHLGDPDPRWREHVAIDGLTAWAYRAPVLDAARRRALVVRLCANLTHGIGASDDDSVLERSFSALMLSTLAAADNQQAFLGANEHDALLAAALAYLRDEHDVRGYDERAGWRHSVAHTADLLKFLARSPQLALDEQHAVLDAIRAKLRAPSTGVLAFGEHERIAKALLSVVRRGDFDRAAFEAWCGALTAESKQLWEHEPLDARAFRALQNQRDSLAALASLLAAVEGENAKFALECAVRALWA